MSIYQTLYVSAATPEVDSQTIKNILATAMEFNSKNNITGVLLFRAGIFLQLLEGDRAKVDALYEKIKKDPRHSNVIHVFSI